MGERVNSKQSERPSPLRVADLRPYLERCGYQHSAIRSNSTQSQDGYSAIVAFSHQPFDVRTACIAVIEVDESVEERVKAIRSTATPIVFALRAERLEWWQQGENPRRIEIVPPDDVPNFFRRHENDFSPDAVYRAKTWGRFDQHFQRSFVDLGLMPLVEKEIGQQLQRLISINVQALKSILNWKTVSDKQGAWLLKTIFWLVSAKILHDKGVGRFRTAELTDVERSLEMVGDHLGADRITIANEKQLAALSEIAYRIGQFSSLELTTTESLAHVYENTMISKATRQALGTHSTPSYLVDYVVGKLTPWIEEIPLADRNVFEPACGHAAFLVSAMRLLTELLPDGQMASQRRQYLRKRIHGCEVDDFALEIARLSLSLTDIPNPNGWDLKLGDMFVGDTLQTMASKAMIMLANPPFENFKDEERTWYSKSGMKLNYANKTAEMLSRVLPFLPEGALIGLIVPQGFLHSKNAIAIRKMLLAEFELQEICLFPDKVFTFADSESAVVTGRKKKPGSNPIRYRRVRERGMDAFRSDYIVTSENMVLPETFLTNDSDLRDRELGELWSFCADTIPSQLQDIAEVGKGLEYKTTDIPRGRKTFSEKGFVNAVRGFVRFEPNLLINELPQEKWMSLDSAVIQAERHGTKTGISQVIFNYARVSRGPWRLKGLLDPQGHPFTTSFVVIRPRPESLVPCEYFWAVINSPLANVFSFVSCGKRHNLTGEMSKLPVPWQSNAAASLVVNSARRFLDYVSQDLEDRMRKPFNKQKACELLLRVDAAVLKMYALPREIERKLLDYFAGWQREGVPFKFDRYFPEHFTDRISLSDYLAITADWTETNRRRTELIHKKVSRTISLDERTELDHLQSLASSRRNLIAPLPQAELDELHRQFVEVLK